MRFALLVLLGLVSAPAVAQEPDIMPLMEGYYRCLVGNGGYSIDYRAWSADEAYEAAVKECAAEEKTLRDTIPLVAHEDGELNEADSVQDTASDALRRLDTHYDPTKPVTRL